MAARKIKTPAPAPAAFSEHLDSVRTALSRTDAAVASLGQARTDLDKCVAITREILFDHLCLCRKSLPEIEDLNEASSIVSRAVQSLCRLHGLGVQNEEQAQQKISDELKTQCAGLPPELREKLEQETKLW